MLKKTPYKQRLNKKKLIILLVLLITISCIVLVLKITNSTFLFNKSSDNSKQVVPSENNSKTTSKEKSAQTDYSDNNTNTDKEAGNTINDSRGSAIIEESTDQPNKNNTPVTSKTGEITVYSPTQNSEVTNGTIISGTSKLSSVQYRIIDSISGVIATGELKVKDGIFSGKISFITNATEGRVDLFATNSDYSEYSNIEIPIKFRN